MRITHFSQKYIIFFQVDLSCETAAVLGQGNVALDVARILLSPIDELRKTDITEHALNTLAESKVRELYVIGRRGPLQVAFTIKEFREQLKLKNCKTIWRDSDVEGLSEVVTTLQRPRKRLTELMLKSFIESREQNSDGHKLFRPLFFRSPNKFLVDNKKTLTGIELICNKLVGDKFEEQRCVPTDEKEIISCGLAFRSIGYKSVKADDELVFANGLLANNGGCVEDNQKDLAKLYVAGWLGTGPVGVILHTMGNAFQVAKTVCEDLKTINLTKRKDGYQDVSKVISAVNSNIVSWSHWEKIDKYEIEQGKTKGKPREKVCDVDKMIEICK